MAQSFLKYSKHLESIVASINGSILDVYVNEAYLSQTQHHMQDCPCIIKTSAVG